MLKRIILRTFILTSLMVMLTTKVNATIITQAIIDHDGGGYLGTISIDLNDVDQSGVINTWHAFSLLDFYHLDQTFEVQRPDPLSNQFWEFFSATIDLDNIAAGIQNLTFILTDVNGINQYGTNSSMSMTQPTAIHVKRIGTNVPLYQPDFVLARLSEVTIEVPEPTSILLFFAGVAALVSRTKRKSLV